MYYEYALCLADQLDKMRQQLGYTIQYPSDEEDSEDDVDGLISENEDMEV